MDPDSSIGLNLFIMAFLLFSNGFFVASEFALVSVRHTRIMQLTKQGSFNAKIASEALKDLDKFIAAVQLGITISSIGLGWVGESTLARLIEPTFAFLPAGTQTFATHSVAVAIAFSLITILHVVVGELMPKSIALQYPEQTALWIARPMNVITKLFTPFIFILNGLGHYLLKLLKIPPAHSSHFVHSIDELNMLINDSYKGGILNETEKDMLQNVFKFSDLTAKQVMIPRPDMTAISSDITLEELNAINSEFQYTRYPVYEDDLDHIIGILHIKDLYPVILKNEEFCLPKILREALLVPETAPLDNLVREFKKRQSQIAIVIDEFGGTSGIVTLEDVLEEIFGEVQDEFDVEESNIKEINENIYIANAMLRIDELNEFFNLEIEEEDIDTIGGLVTKQLGRIAQLKDEVIYDNLRFIVVEIEGARILKIKIVKTVGALEAK